MNVFILDGSALESTDKFSFVIRRRYMHQLKAALLEGHMKGLNYPTILFKLQGDVVGGWIASGLDHSDIVKLDLYHGVEGDLQRREIAPVKVLNNTKLAYIDCFVYVAGKNFHKLGKGALQ